MKRYVVHFRKYGRRDETPPLDYETAQESAEYLRRYGATNVQVRYMGDAPRRVEHEST